MKYALHSVAALAVAALATACSSEDIDNPSGSKAPVTITAYQPNTRVYYEAGTGSVAGYWQAGDKIGVILQNAAGMGTFPVEEFTISSGEGTGKATFTGASAILSNIYPRYAMYPYNSGHKYEWSGMITSTSEDASFTYVLPSSYTYTKVDQDYSQKDGNSFCMPMFGGISDNVVTFNNIGSVICMKINRMPAASGRVTVTEASEASNQLCGSFKIGSGNDGNRCISTSASESDNTVIFTYSGATAGKPGVFYLPVAVGTYTLTVTVTGGEEIPEVTTKALKMERGHLKKVDVTLDYSKEINGHKFVDLGLPSGLLWAETNIGAKTAADKGDYFAWGETGTKTSYTKDNYTFGYTNIIAADNDAATKNWGNGCRMPTKTEFEELCNTDNCSWTWTSKTNSDGTVINGCEIKSVSNRNSIFLPATSGTYGTNGDYWSSTCFDSTRAYLLQFGYISDNGHIVHITKEFERYLDNTVRPVASPE